MPITLTDEPLPRGRIDNFYSKFFQSPCDFPYQSPSSIAETQRLASQTFAARSKAEFHWTCRSIAHIVRSTTPEQQELCIDILNYFPWNDDIPFIDSSLQHHVLQAAVDNNLPDVINYLVRDRKIDVNTYNSCGATALMWAAIEKNAALVALLLSLGADPRLLAPSGKKAIDLVNKDKDEAIYNLLQQKEAELNAANPSLTEPSPNAKSDETDKETEVAPLLGENRYRFLGRHKGYMPIAQEEKENHSPSTSYRNENRKNV